MNRADAIARAYSAQVDALFRPTAVRHLRPVARPPFDWESDDFPTIAVHLTLTKPELRLFRATLERGRPDAPAPVRELDTKILRQLEDVDQ